MENRIMTYINLADLPRDHVFCNLPLRDIRAEIRNNQSKTWRSLAKWGIGSASYNQLNHEVWRANNQFRVPVTTIDYEI